MVKIEKVELAKLICTGRACDGCPIITYCTDVSRIPEDFLISEIHRLICAGDNAIFESVEHAMKNKPGRYKIFLKYCNEIQYENH